jgi:hypothetical protein
MLTSQLGPTRRDEDRPSNNIRRHNHSCSIQAGKRVTGSGREWFQRVIPRHVRDCRVRTVCSAGMGTENSEVWSTECAFEPSCSVTQCVPVHWSHVWRWSLPAAVLVRGPLLSGERGICSPLYSLHTADLRLSAEIRISCVERPK